MPFVVFRKALIRKPNSTRVKFQFPLARSRALLLLPSPSLPVSLDSCCSGRIQEMAREIFAVLLIFVFLFVAVLIPLKNTKGEEDQPTTITGPRQRGMIRGVYSEKAINISNLQYDFYAKKCPRAEQIVRSTMADIFSEHKDVPAALLRLMFHDCFIQGCDASILLDDSRGNNSHAIEKQAIPNQTLKGFERIDMIKGRLESTCPGIVSCADILVLAARDGIVLAGGPFYPIFTGRRDSTRSFFDEALNEIPPPNGNITKTLQLFALRGFSERETVSLLGGHNIGSIGCQFAKTRLTNSTSLGNSTSDFLNQLRLRCNNNSASISSGSAFDNHFYKNLLTGRGLLFSDQQLMAKQSTAELVREYASDDGTTFRVDFARAMVKLSHLGVLTGSQGVVRVNCSMPVN